MSGNTQQIEAIAAEIADKVYIDVAKWHLYLGDAKLHMTLAAAFFADLERGTLTEDTVTQVLRQTRVSLGDGRCQMPLLDLIPIACQHDLFTLLQDIQDQL